ncbi:hypothetical protein TorRG33x02_118730 [Trema orientale]|uniref:Uncharacterized protein n=1 Tax=Trema orientale TaxID=63057 RepID=A0A2P5F3L3_TREOI|nr:hypothetical protein TorRG33x02_118730 [Trema orientale]
MIILTIIFPLLSTSPSYQTMKRILIFSPSSHTKHNKERVTSFLSHFSSLGNIGPLPFLSFLPPNKHSLKETIETTNSRLQLFPNARSKSLYRLIVKGTVDLFNI